MANKPFETYFGERTVLTGAQPVGGDEVLVLRSGTVFRGSNVFIKASAILSDDVTPTDITVTDQWESVGGTLVQDVVTPSFTFAGNIFTYVSPNQIDPTVVSGSVQVTIAADDDQVEVGLFVNDVLIGNPMGITANATEFRAVSVQALHVLQTGDTVEMKVRNRDAIVDITVTNAQLVVG